MKHLLILACLALSSLGMAKVNINTANIDELSALKGIGKSKAELIIAYREKNGEFQNIDDLVNVKGIGDTTLSRIKDDIKLEGETDLSDINP